MNTSFNSRLLTAICYNTSHLCVGLDPDVNRLDHEMRLNVSRILGNVGVSSVTLPDNAAVMTDSVARVAIAEAVAHLCAPYTVAFKPNAAFFESSRTSSAAMQGIARFLGNLESSPIRICDAKRGDIGNTSARYAEAVFTKWGYDAITVNPLMGEDSVRPFLEDPEKGVFLLCLTSNPGAADFLLQNDLYKRIADKATQWNVNDNVGLVVGATRAEHAAAVREIAPELPFLVPGVGAQGGALDEILDAIGARQNKRFLINASRSIMFPSCEADQPYAEAVASAARALRDEVNLFANASV